MQTWHPFCVLGSTWGLLPHCLWGHAVELLFSFCLSHWAVRNLRTRLCLLFLWQGVVAEVNRESTKCKEMRVPGRTEETKEMRKSNRRRRRKLGEHRSQKPKEGSYKWEGWPQCEMPPKGLCRTCFKTCLLDLATSRPVAISGRAV